MLGDAWQIYRQGAGRWRFDGRPFGGILGDARHIFGLIVACWSERPQRTCSTRFNGAEDEFKFINCWLNSIVDLETLNNRLNWCGNVWRCPTLIGRDRAWKEHPPPPPPGSSLRRPLVGLSTMASATVSIMRCDDDDMSRAPLLLCCATSTSVRCCL